MFRFILAALAVFALAACGKDAPSKGPLVLAPSSMQEALTQAALEWSREGHPHPVLSFAGTSALARQVLGGAPADLFISADEEWMDRLAEKALIDPASRADIAGNRLVVIAPAGDATALALLPDAVTARLGNGPLALADPDSVPAGRYARAALGRLELWPAVENRISASENVRAALALVERREAPLGIVYASDAKASDLVVVVAGIPENLHSPIRYPIARLADAKSGDAEDFRAWLAGPKGRAILTTHGFLAP
ncbi:molybdate ABC transporter substrate-binding protein [Tsuneonella sp. HG222]